MAHSSFLPTLQGTIECLSTVDATLKRQILGTAHGRLVVTQDRVGPASIVPQLAGRIEWPYSRRQNAPGE